MRKHARKKNGNINPGKYYMYGGSRTDWFIRRAGGRTPLSCAGMKGYYPCGVAVPWSKGRLICGSNTASCWKKRWSGFFLNGKWRQGYIAIPGGQSKWRPVGEHAISRKKEYGLTSSWQKSRRNAWNMSFCMSWHILRWATTAWHLGQLWINICLSGRRWKRSWTAADFCFSHPGSNGKLHNSIEGVKRCGYNGRRKMDGAGAEDAVR